jgi:hypothetical protein
MKSVFELDTEEWKLLARKAGDEAAARARLTLGHVSPNDRSEEATHGIKFAENEAGKGLLNWAQKKPTHEVFAGVSAVLPPLAFLGIMGNLLSGDAVAAIKDASKQEDDSRQNQSQN